MTAKELRIKTGLSQKKLGQLFGYPIQGSVCRTWQDLERFNRPIKLDVSSLDLISLVKLANEKQETIVNIIDKELR